MVLKYQLLNLFLIHGPEVLVITSVMFGTEIF